MDLVPSSIPQHPAFAPNGVLPGEPKIQWAPTLQLDRDNIGLLGELDNYLYGPGGWWGERAFALAGGLCPLSTPPLLSVHTFTSSKQIQRLWKLFRLLDTPELCALARTCRELAYALTDEDLWKALCRRQVSDKLEAAMN